MEFVVFFKVFQHLGYHVESAASLIMKKDGHGADVVAFFKQEVSRAIGAGVWLLKGSAFVELRMTQVICK